MNEQPLTFGDVVDLHKQLKKQDPFFANMTTSQFAKYANQETGSDLYQAGENDSIAKKYSYYVDKAFNTFGMSDGYKLLGKEIAGLFTDNPRYQDIIGHMAEKTPRMMLEGALTFGTGPIGWAGKALGGLSMATSTYTDTDNLGAAAVTGVSGALFPAFQQTGSRIGGKLAEKALTQEVTTSVSGQQVVNRLPYQNKMAEWGLWGAEKAGSVTGTVANMEVASRLTDSIMGQSTPEDEHLLSVLAGVVPFESAALASRLYKGVPKGQPASETHARLNDLYQGTRAAKRMAVAADTQEAFVNTAEMGVKQPFSPDKPFSPEQQAIIDHPHMEQVREEYRNVLYSMATDGKAITKEALTKEFNLVPKAADALLEKLQNLGHINPDGSLNEARLIRPKDIAQLIKQKKGEPLVPTPKATDPVAKEADKAVTKVLEKALETEANPELDEINAALEEAQLKNDSVKVGELQAKKDAVVGKAPQQTFSEVVEQNGQKVEKIFEKVAKEGAQELMTGEGFDPVSKLPKELTPAIIKKWFRINPQTGVVEAVGKGPKSKDALQNYYPEIEAVLTGQVKPASSEMPPVEKGPQAIVFENAVKTESTTQLESRLDQLNFHLEQLKYGLRAEGVTSDMEIRWKTDWERQREFILTELKRRSSKPASSEMPPQPDESSFQYQVRSAITRPMSSGEVRNWMTKNAQAEYNVLNHQGLFEKFLSENPTVTPEKLQAYLNENAPKAKTVSYGLEGKVSEAQKEYDSMTHSWFETLTNQKQWVIRNLDNLANSDLQATQLEKQRESGMWTDEEYAKAKRFLALHAITKNEPRDTSPRATSAYTDEGANVAAFSSNEPMPEWTTTKARKNVQRVDVVIPQPDAIVPHYNKTTGEQQGVINRTKWQPDNLHENLPNTLGWAMIQYKTGVKEWRNKITGEVVNKDPIGETPVGRKATGLSAILHIESGDVYTDTTHATAYNKMLEAHPDATPDNISSGWYRKGKYEEGAEAYKTWENDAKEYLKNKREWEEIAPKKIGLIVEHQDYHIRKNHEDGTYSLRDDGYRKKYDSWNEANKVLVEKYPILKDRARLITKAAIEQARKEGATHIVVSDAETAMMTEGHDRLATPETAHREASKIEQEPGMRLNYDKILPKIAEELTGSPGVRVSLGDHKNAFGYTERRVGGFGGRLEKIAVPRKNLIFETSPGVKRTHVGGMMYSLEQVAQRLEREGRFTIAGKKFASAEMPHMGADQNKIYTFDGPNADKNKANAERTLDKLNSTTPFEWVMTPLESSDLPPAFKGGKSPAPKVTSWMISKKSDQHIVSSSQEAVDVPQTMPKLLTEGEKPLPPKPEEQWTTQHTLSDSRYIQPGPGENTLNTIPVEQAKTPPQVRPENFNRNMFKEEGVLNSPENQQRVQMKQLGLTEERLQSADRNDVIAMSRVILERLQNAMKELTTSSGDWILHEPTEVTQTGVKKKVVMTQKRGETAHQSQKPLIDSLEEYERSLIQKDLETMSPEQAAGRALNRVLEKIRRSSELYVQKWDETVGKLYEQNPDIYSQAIEKLQFLEQDPNFAGARAQAWLKTAANFVNFMEVPTSLAKASGNRVFEEYSQVAAASVQWFKDTLYSPKDLPPKKQKQAEVWKARVAEEIPKQLNRLETEPGLRFEIIKKYRIGPKTTVASEDTRSMVSPEELTKMSKREPGRAFVEYSNQEIATLMAEVKVLESYIKTQVRGTYEREEGLAKSKRGQEKSMFQSLEELMEERNKEGEGYEGDGWTALREAIVHSSGFLHPDAAFELSHTTDASKKWASWVHRMEAKAQAHELEIVRKMLVEAKHPVPTEPDGVLKILEKQPDKTKKNIRAKAIKDTVVAEILKVDPETGEPDNKRMDVQRLNRFHRIYELYRQGTFGIVTENIPGRKNKEGYQVKPLPVNGFDLKTELLNPLWQRKDGTPLLEGHFMTNYVNPFIKMLSWKAKPDPMAEQFNAVMERNTKLRTAELVLHEYFLHAGLPDGEAKAMAESVLKTTAAFDLDQATFMKLHSGGKNFGQAWITPSQQFVGISLETLAKKMGASPQPVKKFMASWLVGHELSHLLEQNPESAAYRGAMKAIVGVEPEVRANLVEQMFRAVVPKEMQTAEFREQLEVRKAWARLDSTEALADFTSLMALGLSHAKTSKRFLDTVKFDMSIHMQDFMRGNYRNLQDLVNGLHHYTSGLLADSPTRYAQAEFVKSTFEGLQAALRSSKEIEMIHSSWMKLREHSLDNYFENSNRLNDLEHITEFGARVGPDGVAELTTKPASSIMPELKKLKSQFQDIIYGRSKRELEEYLGVQLGTGDRRLTPFNQFVAKYSHIQSVAEASDLLHGANVDSNTALVQIMAPLSTDGKKFNPDYFKKMVDNKQVINAVQKIIIAKQKAERSFTETEMRDTLRNAGITHPEVVKNAITLERIFDEIQGDGTTGLSAFIIRTRMKKSESLMANLIMLNDKNPMAGGTGQMNAKKATLIAEALMNHVRTGDPKALVGLPQMDPNVFQRLVDTAATMRKSEDFYRGQVSNRPWYRPLQRRGDYGVVVRQNGKVVEMRAFDSADKALAFTKEQEAKGLQVNFYDDQIRRSHLKRLDGETIAASAKMDQDVYEEAMVKVGLSPDDVQYMKDLYTPGLAYAKAKVKEGMGGNLSQRKMVAGYEQENLLRGYLDFITGTVHGQSRMLTKQQVDLVMLNPDMTKNPQVRDWLRDHSKTVLQPPTPELVGIKTGVFLMTMAYNLSSMAIEQTQPLAITSSHLAKHGGEAGLAYKLILKNQGKWWAKAFNDNWKPQGIYETALKRAQDAGVLDKGTLGELYNEEDAGLVQLRRLATDQNWLEKGRDILHNKFYQFANISKQFYSISPRATNAIAFLAAFEMAVNHGISVSDIVTQQTASGTTTIETSKLHKVKLTPDAAYQFAVDTVRTTNYTGGTVNRPGFFHGAGQAHGVVGAMYSLGGYTLNSIAMMLRYAEKSFRGQTAAERLANQKAFAMQAAAQFVLAGAMGFPFAAAAITIIDDTWPAVQLKKNLYQLPATLWQMVGGDAKMGGWISDLVMRGPITARTPIDTASRTSLGNVLGINNRTGFSFTDAAGPAVSVLGGLLRATRAASLGQFGEALEQGSPAALRNIVNIVRDGGDFRDYKQRLIKHNDLSDPADATQALMAGIGFKDPMISQEAEKRRMVGKINELEAKRWEGQLNELSDAMLQGKIEEVKLALLKKQAESGGTFNAVAGARSVIDKVLAKTYPSDPFGEGPNSTVAERQKLAMAFPQRQEQIPQLERLKKKTALEAMFRWPGLGTMSNTELTNAVMIDRLRAMNPLLTEDMAASMVRQQLHPLRVR